MVYLVVLDKEHGATAYEYPNSVVADEAARKVERHLVFPGAFSMMPQDAHLVKTYNELVAESDHVASFPDRKTAEASILARVRALALETKANQPAEPAEKEKDTVSKKSKKVKAIKPAKTTTKKAPKAKKEKGAPRASKYTGTIKVVAKENPYREGTPHAKAWTLLAKSKTAEDYLAAKGPRRTLRRSAKKGFIKLSA